jgi:hypothetical protein
MAGGWGFPLPGGEPAMDFTYRGYRIVGIPAEWGGLPLPHAWREDGEVSCLELELEDSLSGLALVLLYLPLAPGVVVRAARLENRGSRELGLRAVASFSLDFPPMQGGLELLASDGAWARERALERRRLGPAGWSSEAGKAYPAMAPSPAPYWSRPIPQRPMARPGWPPSCIPATGRSLSSGARTAASASRAASIRSSFPDPWARERAFTRRRPFSPGREKGSRVFQGPSKPLPSAM